MGSAPRSSMPTPTAWTTTVTTWRSAGRSRRLSDRRAPCEAGARAATGVGGGGGGGGTGRGTCSPAYGRQLGLVPGAVWGAARSGRPPRSRRGGDKQGWGSALPRWAVPYSRPPFRGMDAAHKKRMYLSAHHHHTKPLGGRAGGVRRGGVGRLGGGRQRGRLPQPPTAAALTRRAAPGVRRSNPPPRPREW